MYFYTESKNILGVNVEVKTTSLYPIPWNNPDMKRPDDYYEWQRKTLTYFNQNNDKVVITIPAAESGMNRKRKLQVSINNNPVQFKDSTLLDMNMWLKISDFNLFHFDAGQRQAVTPFVYLFDNGLDDEHHINMKTNGGVFNILHFYIEEMAKLKGKKA